MNHARFVVVIALLLLPIPALADGGVVRTRETQGPFIVTIFSPPNLTTAAPIDVTVLAQSYNTGEVIMDATVTLSFAAPNGANIPVQTRFCAGMNHRQMPSMADSLGEPASVSATRAQAANKLLYGATIMLPATGDWRVQATVRRGDEQATIAGTLPVGNPPRRLAGLWPYLALPPLVISLFCLNQWLRDRSTKTIEATERRVEPAAAFLR